MSNDSFLESWDEIVKNPKTKRGMKFESLQQALPIPISSLTGIPASDTSWRWYQGVYLSKCQQFSNEPMVKIDNIEEGKNLWNMGYFGQKRQIRGSNRNSKSGDNQLNLEECDYIPSMENAALEFHKTKEVEKKEEENDNDYTDSKENTELSTDSSEIDNIFLSPCEAFFLCYGLGCLIIVDMESGAEMSIDEIWATFCSSVSYFPFKYFVYHQLRCKGWVVRCGKNVGSDFVLYKYGPIFTHATFAVKVTTCHHETSSADHPSKSYLSKIPTEFAANRSSEHGEEGRGVLDITLSKNAFFTLTRVCESTGKKLLITEISLVDQVPNWNLPDECLSQMKMKQIFVNRHNLTSKSCISSKSSSRKQE